MIFNGRTLFATGAFSGGAPAAGAQWIDKETEFQTWLAEQAGNSSAVDYFLTLTAAGAYTVDGGWYCVVYNTGGASTQHEIMQIDDENRRELIYIGDVLIAESRITTDGADVDLLQFTVGGKDLASSVGIKEVATEERESGVYVCITLTDGSETTFTVPKGQKGDEGHTPVKGVDYYTPADKAEFEAFIAAELAKRGQVAPEFANSVEECTDTTKIYVLPDGMIYAHSSEPTYGNVTEKIEPTADNPAHDGYQLGSDGNTAASSTYVTSPYIDLSKYSGSITLTLGGLQWFTATNKDKIRVGLYDENKTKVYVYFAANGGSNHWALTDIDATILDDGITAKVNIYLPYTAGGKTIRYLRFATIGAWANADISVTHYGLIEEGGWKSTGLSFVAGNNSESIDIETFELCNAAVKGFMTTADYNDADYSYTNVTQYAGSDYYRKDLPNPVIVGWDREGMATSYTVCINTLAGVLNTGMQTYYTTDNKLAIYNLLPNKTYYYKVYGLRADGTTVLIKDSSFTTSDSGTRMLNIDGIQNVRDVGGYTAAGGAKVKYGQLYRGSAMDEAIAQTLCITDGGKQEFIKRVGVRADLDLRSSKTESALGAGIDFLCVPYENYANAITAATQRGYFKTMLEYIVAQLTNSKPVYIHCQGGCDRTGTLVFLLLGLLGVNESDLAKEYELSSMSNIGKKTRTRNSTTYNYSGMVAAVKAYAGTTIAEKFAAFAADCGIANDTVTSFQNLMLDRS